MKEYWVFYEYPDSYEEEQLIVLPSFRRLLVWILFHARRCSWITIKGFAKPSNKEVVW